LLSHLDKPPHRSSTTGISDQLLYAACVPAGLLLAASAFALGELLQKGGSYGSTTVAVGVLIAGGGILIGALWLLYDRQEACRRDLARAETLATRALEMLRPPSGGDSADELSGRPGPKLARRLNVIIERLEAMLEQHRQREREVLRADQLALVGQMAAGVAHEIRNPLTSIKMLVQSGRKEGAEYDLSDDDLEIIEHEIRRMERSLQRFLDFARPPHPEQRPLDLGSVVTQALALVEGRANKQRVEVRLDSPTEPLTVNADQDQLQQLVLNLLINALDVMPG
jgi:C4-dicarboxylate-specific signal transduction histidine kinase